MKSRNIFAILTVVCILLLSLGFDGGSKTAGLTTIKLYTDETFFGSKAQAIAGQVVNEYILWIGSNRDNIGTDSTTVYADTLTPAAGKAGLRFHVVDGPNPRMWFILFHKDLPTVHDPLDASSTGRVTMWVKSKPGAPALGFWVEDASYAGDAGQTARINISGARVFANGKVIVEEDWNGKWQFVSLPWSLLQSNDVDFVAHTFKGSWTRAVSNFNRSIVRQLQFDTNAFPALVPRPPSGQGYINDFYVDEVQFIPAATAVGVGEEKELPVMFSLKQNYPNPFNPTTEIRYEIPTYTTVTLKIYNVLGQEVRTLLDHKSTTPGSYTVTWDGRDNAGRVVPSGEYLYRIEASHFTDAKKMVLVK